MCKPKPNYLTVAFRGALQQASLLMIVVTLGKMHYKIDEVMSRKKINFIAGIIRR